MPDRISRWQTALGAALILLVNILIAGKWFTLDYSGYLVSIEGTFIAIARQFAAHPADSLWWPWWDLGLPVQNTYLPLLHIFTAAIIRLTGESASLAYHQSSAIAFIAGPVFAFLLAAVLSRRIVASLAGALLYSVISPCVLMIPAIRTDIGGWLRLRRYSILVAWGEGPATLAVSLLPLTMLLLYFALTKRTPRWIVAACVACGLTVLSNAFGATLLVLACLALLAALEIPSLPRNVVLTGAIGLAAWLWISPLFPPSVIAAIRMNSPTVEGDYRFNAMSWVGVAGLAIGYVALWLAGHYYRLQVATRLFLVFSFLTSGVVMLGFFFGIHVLPQSHRYQTAMDLSVAILGALALGALFDGLPKTVSIAVTGILFALMTAQTIQTVRYARNMILVADPASTVPSKLARFVDANMPGQRVMIGGTYSYHFNAFSDAPQLFGGHEPMLPNFTMRAATYQIYSGAGAGTRDGRIAMLWLRALGAHAIHVPGPKSAEYYHPFANPTKFEGLLPVLWREGDDTLYGVPAKSASLAHVIPTPAIVNKIPADGLDTAEIEHYVAALDDPALPEAIWTWTSHHSGHVEGNIPQGDLLSVQIAYARGWHAAVNGDARPLHADGLGMIVVDTGCNGPCSVDLTYDGGLELKLTLIASALTTLAGLWFLLRRA